MTLLAGHSSANGGASIDASIPSVLEGGRWWSPTELEQMVRRWRARALQAIGAGSRFIAIAPPTTHEGVALWVVASTLPVPAILLEPEPAGWRRLPRLPPQTTLLLLPSSAHLAGAASVLGCSATVLSHDGHTDDGSLPLLESPGAVIFTSGSTGAPKPVFRTMAAFAGAARCRLGALGIERGAGIVAGTSLAHGRGVTCIVSTMLLGGPLGLIGPLHHRAALATLALPAFTCWWASAHLADVLGRCEMRGPAVAPRVCLISNRISRGVFDRFLDRFGVPIRQTYSSSETGCISVDAAPPGAVRPETVGRPVDGVHVRVGDTPRTPLPCGEVGRAWVRSPWTASGYGFPPELELPGVIEGWWPMQDVGSIDAAGALSLAGRLDDCIRTREGQLVNLATVARQIEDVPGISAAAVIALDGAAGSSFGAVLESAAPLATLRLRLGDTLPAWARPRKLTLVGSLPRLANGKVDRLACRALLGAGE